MMKMEKFGTISEDENGNIVFSNFTMSTEKDEDLGYTEACLAVAEQALLRIEEATSKMRDELDSVESGKIYSE